MESRVSKTLPVLLAALGTVLMLAPAGAVLMLAPAGAVLMLAPAGAEAMTVGEPLLGPSQVTAPSGQKAVKPEAASAPLPVGQPLDLSNDDVSFGPSLASEPFELIPLIGGGSEGFMSRLGFALRPTVVKNGQVLLAVPMKGTAISLSIGAGSIFISR